MTRRKSRPLTSVTGVPFWDQVSRTSRKRPFRQITLGGLSPPPIPSPGQFYRTVYASSITDTEGISDTAWSTGTTGLINGVAGTNWNCLYLHAVTPSMRTGPLTYNMDPIRWQFDAPSALTGGSYDHWWKRADTVASGLPAPAASQIMCGHPLTDFSPFGNAGPGALGIINTALCANTHGAFTDDTIKLDSFPQPESCQVKTTFPVTWKEATLQAISAVKYGVNFTTSVNAIEHYVNGVGLGLIENPDWPPRYTSSDWHISTISPGDTYHLDVWYRLDYLPASNRLNTSGKMCSYLVTTKTTNSSRRRVSAGIGKTSHATFYNVDWTPAFNFQSQTYRITIAGHTGWTLKDGSNGPHKIETDASGTGWTAVVKPWGILFTPPPTETQYVKQIRIDWDRELASIEIDAGQQQIDDTGVSDVDQWLIRYRPQNSGDYATSTSSADLGTITHAPAGVFNQAGTTTFGLCDASMIIPQYKPNHNFTIDTDGRTTGLIPSYPSVPTTITLTRVDK